MEVRFITVVIMLHCYLVVIIYVILPCCVFSNKFGTNHTRFKGNAAFLWIECIKLDKARVIWNLSCIIFAFNGSEVIYYKWSDLLESDFLESWKSQNLYFLDRNIRGGHLFAKIFSIVLIKSERELKIKMKRV